MSSTAGCESSRARVCSRIVCPAILISCLGISRPTRAPTPPARITATFRLMPIASSSSIALRARNRCPTANLTARPTPSDSRCSIRSRCSGHRLPAAVGQRLGVPPAPVARLADGVLDLPDAVLHVGVDGRAAQVDLVQLGQEAVVVLRLVVHPEDAPRVLGVRRELLRRAGRSTPSRTCRRSSRRASPTARCRASRRTAASACSAASASARAGPSPARGWCSSRGARRRSCRGSARRRTRRTARSPRARARGTPRCRAGSRAA